MKGQLMEAQATMSRLNGSDAAKAEIDKITKALQTEKKKKRGSVFELFKPALRMVLTIGIVVAVLQQITGINSVFFYAPMIFKQSGIGTDASMVSDIMVGLVNLAFTVLAMLFIDKLGRKPLLSFGVAGIAVAMFILSYGFGSATYTLAEEGIAVAKLCGDCPCRQI